MFTFFRLGAQNQASLTLFILIMDFLKINNLLEPVLEQLRVSAVSADEKDLLKGRFWDAGEDIRLREDWRFRQTPWGKWTTAASYLANDEIFSALRDQAPEPIKLPEALQDLQKTRGIIAFSAPQTRAWSCRMTWCASLPLNSAMSHW